MTAVPPPVPPPRKSFASRYARELSAAVGGPLTVWLIGWSHPYIFNLSIAIVAVIALYEFLLMGQKKGYHLPVALCIVIALVIISAFVLEQLSVEVGMFLTLLLIPASYVFNKRIALHDALPSSAIAVLATMYVGMLAGSLIRLRNDFPVGPKLVFFLLIVVWIGDAGAYYVGRQFGRHKLSPHISPKKTVEGLIGGVCTSIIAAIVIHYTFFPEFALPHAAIVGSVLSMCGVVGDLAESMWKRSADVKDSGTLIPGHGGFLDRFDSILFTAPMLYFYWALAQGAKSLNLITG